MTDYITYKNVNYQIKAIKIKAFGDILISTTDLSDNLMDQNGSAYQSEEARVIDEQIFFFVEPHQINFTYKKLKKILEKAV